MTTQARAGLIIVAIIVAFLVAAYIKDEIHNHTPQGRFDICIHDKDVQSTVAGANESPDELMRECQEETGYKP
jgi:hypothetical protein